MQMECAHKNHYRRHNVALEGTQSLNRRGRRAARISSIRIVLHNQELPTIVHLGKPVSTTQVGEVELGIRTNMPRPSIHREKGEHYRGSHKNPH